MLSLEEIQRLFNKFFPEGRRFFGDLLDSWIQHPDSKKRVFGVTQSRYAALDRAGKDAAKKIAKDQMGERYGALFQRRHDCIHNCDRPRVAPQRLVVAGTVLKVIEDVEFLVERCDTHIGQEFRRFLLDAGCPSAIVAQAGYGP